jgi:hypothetical protein
VSLHESESESRGLSSSFIHSYYIYVNLVPTRNVSKVRRSDKFMQLTTLSLTFLSVNFAEMYALSYIHNKGRTVILGVAYGGRYLLQNID